ncbi:unnamed protein product [Closterium sp. NIES-65]|nr:unnamed protein product [Closterium sp. NIES-65]
MSLTAQHHDFIQAGIFLNSNHLSPELLHYTMPQHAPPTIALSLSRPPARLPTSILIFTRLPHSNPFLTPLPHTPSLLRSALRPAAPSNRPRARASSSAGLPAAPARAAAAPLPRALYIVQLRSAPPVAAYHGGIPGFPATAVLQPTETNTQSSPSASASSAASAGPIPISTASHRAAFRRRARINSRLPAVRAFQRMLRRQQRQVAADARVRLKNVIYSYTHVANGFAAKLTAGEARRMRRHPAVGSVTRSGRFRLLTTASPAFLQLPPSLWAAASGQSSAGEDVVVGVVDTGIWPEHKSFADDGNSSFLLLATRHPCTPCCPRLDPCPFLCYLSSRTATPPPSSQGSYSSPATARCMGGRGSYSAPPATWVGSCEVTDDFPVEACSNKVVGARWFIAGMQTQSKGQVDMFGDYLSPRDAQGHGTWCAGCVGEGGGVGGEGEGGGERGEGREREKREDMQRAMACGGVSG